MYRKTVGKSKDKRMESNENVPAKVPKLFNDDAVLASNADAAAVARATQEIQAALVIAQRFARDEVRVKSRILEACKRKELAEVAEYEYSRGGTRITGPTIDLLRAVANRWGNIRHGWAEVSRSTTGQGPGVSSIRTFAWDLQTNAQAERTFSVVHWRDTQAGGYPLTDERDIYELLANNAARRVRACLEEVIDSDIVTAAIDQCRRTLREGEKVPLKDRAVSMVSAFSEYGVTQKMIETRLGNLLDAVSENQLASLRRIFKALKDGVGKREDYFKAETVAPVIEPPAVPVPAPPTETKPLRPPPPEPPKAPPVAPPAPVPENPLQKVRALCKRDGVGEGQVLDFLHSTGATDGSEGTLDEVALRGDAVIAHVLANWPDIVRRIKP